MLSGGYKLSLGVESHKSTSRVMITMKRGMSKLGDDDKERM